MVKSKLSLKKKIWLLALFQMLNLTVVGFVSWFYNQKLSHSIKDMAEVNEPAVENIGFLNTEFEKLQAVGVLTTTINTPLTKEKKDNLQSNFNKHSGDFIAKLNNLSHLKLDPSILEKIDKSNSTFTDYVKSIDELVKLSLTDNFAEIRKKAETFEQSSKNISATIDAIDDLIGKMTVDDFMKAESSAQQSNTVSFLLIFIGLGVALAFSYVTIQHIIKSLAITLEQITHESTELNHVSVQIYNAAQDLSQSTTEQAAAIEETVASSEEMASMLSQTAQHSAKSLQITEDGRSESQRGLTVMNRLGSAMDDIQETNEKLESLVRLIEEIKSKTKVINDIVFETRLLSFNASIEAARAGSHGKGFAVVAEEVGKLATMSGKAADEIRTLLESSTSEVSSIVRNTQEKVSVGKNVSIECQSVFQSMGDTLLKIDESVTKIVSATKEQEIGIKQTNRAMSELDTVTNTNSQASEKLASQSDKLFRTSREMDVTMKSLQLLVYGQESQPQKEITEVKADVSHESQLKSKSKGFKPSKEKVSSKKYEENANIKFKSESKPQVENQENKESTDSGSAEQNNSSDAPSRSGFKWKKAS